MYHNLIMVIRAIEHTCPFCQNLHWCGTAVGTGIQHAKVMMLMWRKHTIINRIAPFCCYCAENKFEALAAHDAIVEAHGALKTVACSL